MGAKLRLRARSMFWRWLERKEQAAEWIRLTVNQNDGGSEKLSQLATVSKGGRGLESGIRAASRELGMSKDAAHRAVKVASLPEQVKQAVSLCPCH